MIRTEHGYTIYLGQPEKTAPLLDRVEYATHWMNVENRPFRELPCMGTIEDPTARTVVLCDIPSVGRQRLYVELARLYEFLVIQQATRHRS